MTTRKALNGKPYVGNPHVRVDEEAGAPAATPRRGSRLYNANTRKALAVAAAICMAGGHAFASNATGPCTTSPVKYAPVPGGFAACNGDGEFNRPLYGWHGDDRELKPCKSLPWTGDRPKVALKVFRGYRIDKKVRGVLQLGDGTEDVEYRYVWGRAEYDLKGKGTVKMVRSAQSDGLLVETTGNLPPKFDG